MPRSAAPSTSTRAGVCTGDSGVVITTSGAHTTSTTTKNQKMLRNDHRSSSIPVRNGDGIDINPIPAAVTLTDSASVLGGNTSRISEYARNMQVIRQPNSARPTMNTQNVGAIADSAAPTTETPREIRNMRRLP
ncbi:hypothetical protein AIIKEEIJ_05664 [Rhodococcus sp. YH1]|nr:hypothetical protein [Rhodococcus sp. YH1]